MNAFFKYLFLLLLLATACGKTADPTPVPVPSPTTYSSAAQTYTTTPADYTAHCTSGTGAAVTITNAAGFSTSTTSQAAADNTSLTDATTRAKAAIVCTAAATAPATPTAPSATISGQSIVVAATSVTASNGATITSYVLYRNGTLLAPTAQLPYTDNTATAGVSYTYSYSATNSVGTGTRSPASASVTVPIPATAPAQPAAPTATVSGQNIVVSQSAVPANGGSAITSYALYRSASGAASTLLTASATFPYTDNAVTVGVSYTYSYSATNSAGTSPMSPASAAVTVPVANPMFALSLKPYPDPSYNTRAMTWTAYAGTQLHYNEPTAANSPTPGNHTQFFYPAGTQVAGFDYASADEGHPCSITVAGVTYYHNAATGALLGFTNGDVTLAP